MPHSALLLYYLLSAILNELGNIDEDAEDIEMVTDHYKNLLTRKSRNTNKKRGGRYN